MRYAFIFTIAMVAMGFLSSPNRAEGWRPGQVHNRSYQGSGQDLRTAEIDLYSKPKPKPKPDLTKTQKEILKAYPVLSKTDAVIVVFGAEWCTACKRQVLELKGPSTRYNVLVYDVEKEGKKLAELLKVGRSIPVIMVLENGKPTKTFLNFTPWVDIKPHAKKAKKNEEEQKGRIDIGPIHIDWDLDGYDSDQYRRRRK